MSSSSGYEKNDWGKKQKNNLDYFYFIRFIFLLRQETHNISSHIWSTGLCHCQLFHHCIRLCVCLVQCQSESSQVLLYLLDQGTVPLHELIQGRDSSPLFHLQVGQGNPQILIQDSLDFLIFPNDTLPYH